MKKKSSRLALVAGLLLAGAHANAQMRSVVISDATVVTGNGRVYSKASVSYQGGKITGLGPRVRAGFLSKTIDGAGKFITPGLIDVWSGMGVPAIVSEGQASGQAADAYDAFDRDAIEAALAQGVTTVYVPARAIEGAGGLGAVVRLVPTASADAVIKDDAAVCFSIGARGERALGRLARTAAFRKRWQDAKDYRTAREDYEFELEEYEKKLKERAEKGESSSKDESVKKKDAGDKKKKDDKPKNRRRRRRRPRPRPRPQAADAVMIDRAVSTMTAENGENGERDGENGADENGKNGEKKSGDEIKKPEEPARDPEMDVLLRALDGEIPVRVEVYQPADILNVLEVGEEFNLRLILEGATGAHRVAEPIAKAEVPVILDAPVGTMRHQGDPRRHASNAALQTLQDAGVRVFIASGPDAAGSTAHLALRVAAAIGHGLAPKTAVQRITGQAAELLEIADAGQLRVGRSADFVVWSADPLDPTSRVESVVVGGEEVWKAPKQGADE